jgi:hypothetical protein
LIWIDESYSTNKIVRFGPVEKGESECLEIQCGPLTYEGHAVCGISGKRALNHNDEGVKITSDRPDKHLPVYSFSVWDESHYESTVRRPKKLQFAIIFTSIVLTVFAAIQIILSL